LSSNHARSSHPTSRFSPYGPDPFIGVAAVRRQVCEFLLSELVRWLVQSGQIDISVPAGRRRLRDGDHFASTVI
jgi:hypothetical protein